MFTPPCLTSTLRKRKSGFDFAKPQVNAHDTKAYYDLEYDRALIEASFASQYGIRLRQEPDITLSEFINLLSGLAGETPLGRVVAVRMEKSPEVIKKFGDWEKGVRRDWARFKAGHIGNERKVAADEASGKTAQEIFKQLFGRG